MDVLGLLQSSFLRTCFAIAKQMAIEEVATVIIAHSYQQTYQNQAEQAIVATKKPERNQNLHQKAIEVVTELLLQH